MLFSGFLSDNYVQRRDGMRKCTFLALLAIVGLSGVNGFAGNKEFQIGEIEGKQLYWQAESNVLDTIGWDVIIGRLLQTGNVTPKSEKAEKEDSKTEDNERPSSSITISTINEAAGILQKNGMNIYELNKPSAISIALAHKLGYKVVMLTSWGSTSQRKFSTNRPCMSRVPQKQRIVTDFLWEMVNGGDIQSPSSLQSDWQIKLHFLEGGFSHYKGNEGIILSEKQITGTEGFVLSHTDLKINEEMVMYRIIKKVYLVADAKQKPKKVTSTIEGKMDELNLDLSFKSPTLKLIKKSK